MTANNAEAANGSRATGDQLVVVGGSQAGLAMAWHLARQHLRFVVLDAAPEIGHTWSSRWDSLRLFTPTQHDALPGMAFPGPPDTYPGKDAVAGYLKAYAAALPGSTPAAQPCLASSAMTPPTSSAVSSIAAESGHPTGRGGCPARRAGQWHRPTRIRLALA